MMRMSKEMWRDIGGPWGTRRTESKWSISRGARLSGFVLVAAFCLSTPAQAQLLAYTITGTIDPFDLQDLNGTNFEIDSEGPFPDIVPYVLTFDLNLASPLTNSGPTFASYGTSVTNLFLDIDNGFACVDATIDGITQTYSGPGNSLQTWAPGAGDFGPTCALSIPEFDVVDFDTEEVQTVAFSFFEAVLFNFSGGLYSTFPPPLLDADLMDADSAVIELRFDGISGGPMPAFVSINGTIDSITVPEPGVGGMLAAGVLGLGAAGRRRRLHD